MKNDAGEYMLEVRMSPPELRSVIKSLSIGIDQLAKKYTRLNDGRDRKALSETREEMSLILSAKQEMENVLQAYLMAVELGEQDERIVWWDEEDSE
jgi:hypothetical protein